MRVYSASGLCCPEHLAAIQVLTSISGEDLLHEPELPTTPPVRHWIPTTKKVTHHER